MTRAHFLRPILEMVGHGVTGDDTPVGLLTGATVAIYQPGTTTLISDSLFTGNTGGTTLVNPFVCASGIVDFYLDTPQRVDFGVTPVGGTENIVSSIDVAVYDSTVLSASFADIKRVFSDVAATASASGALVVNKHNPCDASSGNLAMTLANATVGGQLVAFEKFDSSLNTVTVTLNLRGTPGQTETLSSLHETEMFVSKADGSWWPVSGFRSKAVLDANYAPLARPYVSVATAGTAQSPAPTVAGTVINYGLNNNITITMPSPVAGMRWYLRLLQDATGSRIATWAGSAIRWPGGSAPTLTTTANSSDNFTFTAFDNSAWTAGYSQDVR